MTAKDSVAASVSAKGAPSELSVPASVAETRRVLGRKANRHLLPHYDALRAQRDDLAKALERIRFEAVDAIHARGIAADALAKLEQP